MGLVSETLKIASLKCRECRAAGIKIDDAIYF